jgi:hypothetical protein
VRVVSDGIPYRFETAGLDTYELHHSAVNDGFGWYNATDGFYPLLIDHDGFVKIPDGLNIGDSQDPGTNGLRVTGTAQLGNLAIGTNAMAGTEKLVISHSGIAQRIERSGSEPWEIHQGAVISGLGFYNATDGEYRLILKEDGTITGNGSSLTLDASGFNGNLTTGTTNLQQVAQALDDLVASGSQTPWTSDIDGGGFNLTNVASIEFDEGYFGTLYLSNIVAGSLLKVVDDGSGNVYVTNAVAGVDYPAVPEILTTVTDGSTNLVDSDAIYDAIAAGGGSSPTTTRGDLIRRGAATDERLAVGSFGDGLLSDGTDPAWYAPQNYVRRFDDFTTTSGTVIGETGWTSALANSGTAAAGTGESGRPGVWVLSTTTSGTASALLVRQFLSDVFGGGVMRFECSIKLSALSDGTDTYTAMFGWFDTSSTSPTDGAYIRYTHSVNSGNWQGITRSNSSETPVNGSVAASTSWTKLGIQVAADGSSVEFFVDGVSIGTSSATIPTGAGRETGLRLGIIKSAGTTARTVSLDYTSELFKPTSTR